MLFDAKTLILLHQLIFKVIIVLAVVRVCSFIPIFLSGKKPKR